MFGEEREQRQHRRSVTMRELGSRGRFGNQLLQRSFIKAYAQENNADWGVTPWVGKWLFGLDDSGITEVLPKFPEKCIDGDVHRPVPPDGAEFVGHDYAGWAQFPTAWWTPDRRRVWRDYQPADVWQRRMQPAVDRLAGHTAVGIQIRRGDYGLGSCYDAITPVEWYQRWLFVHWCELNMPRLFVATEDRSLVDEFSYYGPETVESLGVELRAEPYPFYNYNPEDLAGGKPHLLDWFPEWFMLTQCDVLLAANSTFSLTAAMASQKIPEFWRPAWEPKAFVREDVWDCLPLRLDCPRKTAA
jgi:hypothetical protein